MDEKYDKEKEKLEKEKEKIEKKLEDLNSKKTKEDNKILTVYKKYKKFIIIAIIAIIAIIIIANNIKKNKEEERYNSLPPKLEYTMTSFYGSIDDILDELGLDFDLVTAGANCFTGVVKNEYKTEKYGILHTEFRYCKSNKTTTFRVYNDENDQELRTPRNGELPTFDKYGDLITSSGI